MPGERRPPRLLVTGFEAFPGAPVNPTAWLVERLREEPPPLQELGGFHAAVLPVDYARIGTCLSELGQDFAPDIAIHFGLARNCRGFRLERRARNRFDDARPDNAGFAPADGPICAGPDLIEQRLPLGAIFDGLSAAELPVEWSDDAGGYLCNMALTLSLANACDGFAPAMCGFVHVCEVGLGQPLSRAALLQGARIIIKTTVDAWSTFE